MGECLARCELCRSIRSPELLTMKVNVALGLAAAALMSFAFTAAACAADDRVVNDRGAAGDEESWAYTPSYAYRPNPEAIIHAKAQARAQQRMSRIAAMRWYGMYNERPTASPTPFTALYSPVWQMPGGRPYAWHYRGASSVLVLRR